jgi:hypothetical protein
MFLRLRFIEFLAPQGGRTDSLYTALGVARQARGSPSSGSSAPVAIPVLDATGG